MDRKYSFASISSRSSSSSSIARKSGPLLPSNSLDGGPLKAKSLLTHCLYRRVFIWMVISLVLASLVLFRSTDGAVYDAATTSPAWATAVVTTSTESNSQPTTQPEHVEAGVPLIVAVGSQGDQLEDSKENKQISQSSQEDKTHDETQDVTQQHGESYETHEEHPGEVRLGQQQSEEKHAEEAIIEEIQPEERPDDQGPELGAEEPSKVDQAQQGDQSSEKKQDDWDDYEEEEEVDEDGMTEEERKKFQLDVLGTPWLIFKHLNAYFFGLKTLVNIGDHKAEYPDPQRLHPVHEPPLHEEIPKPKPYNPYHPGEVVRTCYIDEANQIPAPDIYAYDGVPQHFPDPAIGSYELLGLRDDVCFDRFGRYGPYGLGYDKLKGGTGVGLDTESSDNDEVWSQSGQINYVGVNWASAQKRCYEANKDRFLQVDTETKELKQADGKKGRMAVIIRLYTQFTWTDHVILNFRALVNELSLKSGGEYDVHFLMHVRDNNAPIWADEATAKRILEENVPPEFRSMVTLWSEAQMKLMYPGRFDDAISNPSAQDIHGVYRSAHMPLQVFALNHPEYEHIWNWEMDMRYVGSYYELFDRIGKWAEEQPRSYLWERSERYYIPSYHGSWENFTNVVQQTMQDAGRTAIFGPMDFPGHKTLLKQEKGEKIMPPSCDGGQDSAFCGVGEAADLITVNPMFDTDQSGWIFGLDVTGYGASPPRRCAIVTASRLSRRLIMAMHEEVWRHHHSMFSEMFPSSVALHHGFKALYAPHPVFLDRAWNPPSRIDAAFNGGRDHSTSGSGSPYDLRNEHNHKGTTWYYHSEFAGLLWRRWLGYAQPDGRGHGGGRANEGAERGGKKEESSPESTGRMCLRSMLAHPIKFEHPSERR